MNIHEYQAKEILGKYGVRVQEGVAIMSPDDIDEAFKNIQASVYVVKAQIHAGGRGKAGGVKVFMDKDAAKKGAKEMFGKVLVTPQTGPEGKMVNRVYVVEGADIKKEYYLSLVVDPGSRAVCFIASTEGGVEIEEVAHTNPEKIHKIVVDPVTSVQLFHARKLAKVLGLDNSLVKDFSNFVLSLYKAFVDTDASQLEINPLVLTEQEQFLALDAKFNFDDNALYRHKYIAEMRDETEEDPLEVRAGKSSLNYVKMDGEIGCMVNGAGLAMATMDIIKLYGSEPANFLDVGGGATKERVTEAFKIILSDSNVKAILVNIFGGIMRCDIIAEGIVAAAKEIGLNLPLVVRLAGTNFELGKKILESSGLKILSANDLADAAEKVVAQVRN
jgi:succinyl-CoA synthetase beta subunit